MLLIHYRKKVYSIPESFNELTRWQLIRLAGMIIKDLHNERKVLQILLDKNVIAFARIPRDAKARMIEFIDWVFGANTLTEQAIKSYKGFYGAKSEFDNLTLAEFHFTELFYKQ